MDDHVIEALNRQFGKKMESLTHQQVMALALAYSEEEITNERLQHVLDMHRADITDMLSKMCSMQLLESSGYGRGTKYHVYGLSVDVPKSNIGLEDPYMGLNMGTSEANMDSSGANMALNMDTSEANMDSSSSNMALGMDGSRVQKVHPMRYNKEQLRELIANRAQMIPMFTLS